MLYRVLLGILLCPNYSDNTRIVIKMLGRQFAKIPLYLALSLFFIIHLLLPLSSLYFYWLENHLLGIRCIDLQFLFT